MEGANTVKKHILWGAAALALTVSAALTSCGGAGGGSELTVARQAMNKAEQQRATLSFEKNKEKAAKIQTDIDGLYKTAYSTLQREVMLGSSSANIAEAWYLLGKASKEIGNVDSMVASFKQADKLFPAEDKLGKQARSEMTGYMFEGWANGFNKGVEAYNVAVGTEDEKARKPKFEEAVKFLSGAAAMKPENIDIYPIIAAAQQGAGDTVGGLATYEKYLAYSQASVDALAQRGATLNMTREEALAKLGKPASSKGLAPQPGDSLILDKYSFDGKEVWVFYPRNKDGKFTLDGFKSNIPASWAPFEQERFVAYDNRVNMYIAYPYYSQKNYDKSLQYVDNGLKMKPSDEELLNFQSQIYTESGRLEQAMAKLKELIAKYPDNKNYLAQYGSMLSNASKFDEAIELFEKVLKLDPQSDIATFNIAAAYKNKAGNTQKTEQDAFDKAEAARKKDKKVPEYKIDVNKYFPSLKKSAEYFEKYRKLPGKDRNIDVLEQLINIYDVVDDKENYRKSAGEFAALEYANEKNPRFYETISRIYGKQKNSAKVKESLDKADALRKAGAK
jgi:tetratricopeptide (TPR) repeat protein